MKRTGNLFERVCSFQNLVLAALRAARGKRYRAEVLRFNFHLEESLLQLRRELLENRYLPGEHRHFRILEPKVRWISAAPFRDRVLHHAICNVIEPLIDRRLIHDCWANRLGRGSHRAVLRYQRFAGRCSHALKMDLRKYFASVDHEILKGQFRSYFKDPRLLDLLDLIVDRGVNPEEVTLYFPGDDLFTPLRRRRGIPIGNLTSQLFANSYLDAFDHWIKEKLSAACYLRFVDDFVLLSNSVSELAGFRKAVENRLLGLRLLAHERKCVIRRTDEGLPFLGYVVWPDRIRVRGETVRRFRRRHRRRLRQIAKQGAATDQVVASLAAWRGHVRFAGEFRREGALLS